MDLTAGNEFINKDRSNRAYLTGKKILMAFVKAGKMRYLNRNFSKGTIHTYLFKLEKGF